MQELPLAIWERSGKAAKRATRDIDEALFLGDRIYVMTARPGRSKEEIAIPLPRPRGVEVLTSPEFVALKRRVVSQIREKATRATAEGARDGGGP